MNRSERRSLGEHDVRAVQFQKFLNQARHIVWAVLAVRVQHQHRVAVAFRREKGKPDGDGALVPEVAAQAQPLDAAQSFQRLGEERRGGLGRRAVINQEHAGRHRGSGECGVEFLNHQPCARPVIEDRHEQDEFERRRLHQLNRRGAWLRGMSGQAKEKVRGAEPGSAGIFAGAKVCLKHAG